MSLHQCNGCFQNATGHLFDCPTRIQELEDKLKIATEDLASAKAFHANICHIVKWYHDADNWTRDLACVEQAVRDSIAGRSRA